MSARNVTSPVLVTAAPAPLTSRTVKVALPADSATATSLTARNGWSSSMTSAVATRPAKPGRLPVSMRRRKYSCRASAAVPACRVTAKVAVVASAGITQAAPVTAV